MHIICGLLKVTIKHTYPHGRKTIYQRAIPKDLRDRYGGKATLKVPIDSQVPAVVAREAARLSAQIDAEWLALRGDPAASPKALKAHAEAYLMAAGVALGAEEAQAVELLHDHWDTKRQAWAGGDELAYREAHPTDYLGPVEQAAWQRLHVAPVDTVSDLLGVYVETHRKRDDEKWRVQVERIFTALTAIIGDKSVAQVNREDARKFMQARLDAGSSTGTVRRMLNVYGAAWNAYRLEKNPETVNPFEALSIPGEGEDVKRRQSLTAAQLAHLYGACRETDDDVRWLFALMMDTGARLAEVAGLLLSDIDTTSPVPHITIKTHPWRPLKTASSTRQVPLVGASLWAAERILKAAADAGRGSDALAFPRYTNARSGHLECKATHASNTLVKWMKSQGVDGLNHELRHTLIDRLRAVGCPKDVRMMITGHTSQDQHDGYGQGHTMTGRHEWLLKVAL